MSTKLAYRSLVYLMAGILCALAAGLLAGGGGSASSGFTPAAVPGVPDLGGMTANEWLMALTDRKPLGGIIPTQLESRADVYKGLDQVDPNDDHVVIGWLSASLGSAFFTERKRGL